MQQFIDIAGASGAVYRFQPISGHDRLPATAGNFLFVRGGSDAYEVICCGMTSGLAQARAAWSAAVEQHQVTAIFVRLNVSRAVRVREHEDIIAGQNPAMVITDLG